MKAHGQILRILRFRSPTRCIAEIFLASLLVPLAPFLSLRICLVRTRIQQVMSPAPPLIPLVLVILCTPCVPTQKNGIHEETNPLGYGIAT